MWEMKTGLEKLGQLVVCSRPTEEGPIVFSNQNTMNMNNVMVYTQSKLTKLATYEQPFKDISTDPKIICERVI